MKILLTCCLISACTYVAGQVQLTNFTRANASQSSGPTQFFKFGNSLIFLATNEQTGREIWITEGATGQTRLLKDIHLGTGSPVFSNFVEYERKLYFMAHDGINGHRLWESDGSTDGTHPVTDDLGAVVGRIVQDGNFIYFLKRHDKDNVEVWRTDGTQIGTTLVKGGIPAWNEPQNVTSALGLIFFSVQVPESHTSRVWRTDGTEAGTFQITEPLEGIEAERNGRVHPSQFIEYNNSLFLIARSTFSLPNNVGIIKTDGTVEGTEHLIGIHPGSEPITFADVIVHNYKMYFTFFDLTKKRSFIWVSQGLAVSTTKIYDHISSAYFSPSTVYGAGEYLYLTSGNTSNGTSLVKLHSLTGAVETIKELTGEIEPPFIFLPENAAIILPASPGNMYIKMPTGNIMYSELWSSNGSGAGTVKLSRISTAYENLGMLVNDQLYFSGGGTGNLFELWKSDGTTAGTTLAMDINPSLIGISFATPLITVNGKAVFTADYPQYGQELIISDGTPSGTTPIDLVPGSGGSFPMQFIIKNDKVYFIVSAGSKVEVFATDGTHAGTKQITNLFASGFRVSHISPGPEDQIFVFGRSSLDNTASLFTLNSTSAQLTELKNFGKSSVNFSLLITSVASVNNTLYFSLDGEGENLWRSDGTSTGTTKIADFIRIDNFKSVGDHLYFTAKTPSPGDDMNLYRSNGTSEGTVLLTKPDGSTIPNPKNLFPFNDKLVFTAFDTDYGNELWIVVGTSESATLLKDINQGKASSMPSGSQFSLQGNLLFFAANDGQHGSELWRTDGSDAGTLMVKDIVSGTEGSNPTSFSTIDASFYFSAYTAQAGYEVWNSDGTAEGTTFVVDVLPGAGYSNPERFIKLDDNLLFFASTLSSGRQLWSYKEENITATTTKSNRLVSVYPNPTTSGIITVKTEETLRGIVSVFNVQGVCVAAPTQLSPTSEVSLAHLPPGVYYLKLTTERSQLIVRAVKL